MKHDEWLQPTSAMLEVMERLLDRTGQTALTSAEMGHAYGPLKRLGWIEKRAGGATYDGRRGTEWTLTTAGARALAMAHAHPEPKAETGFPGLAVGRQVRFLKPMGRDITGGEITAVTDRWIVVRMAGDVDMTCLLKDVPLLLEVLP